MNQGVRIVSASWGDFSREVQTKIVYFEVFSCIYSPPPNLWMFHSAVV